MIESVTPTGFADEKLLFITSAGDGLAAHPLSTGGAAERWCPAHPMDHTRQHEGKPPESERLPSGHRKADHHGNTPENQSRGDPRPSRHEQIHPQLIGIIETVAPVRVRHDRLVIYTHMHACR